MRERYFERLGKALAARSDFAPALYNKAKLHFLGSEFERAKDYIDRYHLVARANAQSLWLAIRSTLELDADGDVSELAQRLGTEFPDSPEYQDWLEIQ